MVLEIKTVSKPSAYILGACVLVRKKERKTDEQMHS